MEVCNEGLWGSICDDSWDNREAGVVCRQLGYPEDQEHLAVHSAFFGAAAAPIHLSELSCEGTEERLVECSRPPFGEHNCQHDEDAGVVCTSESPWEMALHCRRFGYFQGTLFSLFHLIGCIQVYYIHW